jgi:hypothetical protein
LVTEQRDAAAGLLGVSPLRPNTSSSDRSQSLLIMASPVRKRATGSSAGNASPVLQGMTVTRDYYQWSRQ